MNRARVFYRNRYTGEQHSALVVSHRAKKPYPCSSCETTIVRGGLYWMTSNLDGRLCPVCFLASLEGFE